MRRRRSPISRRPVGDRRSERGVALVEFSFVALVLFALVAGTFDFGLAWRSGLALTEAARTGARVGGGLSKSPATDYTALTGVRASLTSSGLIDDVEVVVIYQSSSVNGTPPSGCTTPPYTSGTANCIVLTGEQLVALGPGNFAAGVNSNPPSGTGCISGNYTRRATSWCPTARNNSISTNGQYYGVYVRYTHDFLFPIMGDDRTITRTAVMRLEPEPI